MIAGPHLCCLFTLLKQTFVFLDFGFVHGIKYNPIVLLVLIYCKTLELLETEYLYYIKCYTKLKLMLCQKNIL